TWALDHHRRRASPKSVFAIAIDRTRRSRTQRSTSDYGDAIAGHAERYNPPTGCAQGLRYLLARLGLANKNHAASAAGATYFSRLSSAFHSHLHQPFDQRRGYPGSIF